MLATAVAPWLGTGSASATTEDPRATVVQGNATTCEDIGFATDSQIGADSSSGSADAGFTVTNDGTYLDYTAPDGVVVDAAVVKGGDAYNVYPAGVTTDLRAPTNGGDQVPAISHWFICYHSGGSTEVAEPEAAFADTCTATTVTFTAGSEAVDFEVTAPDGSESTVSVPADGETQVSYPADAAHAATSVAVGETTLADHTWTAPEGGCEGEQPGAAPDVSFSDDCEAGIVVTLSNEGAEGADDAVFEVTDAAGAVLEHTVAAGDSLQLTFPDAADGDTVTVLAPGSEKAVAHTFDSEGCTEVLGEETEKPTVKPTTTVLGERTVTLPFTGPRVGGALVAAVLLFLVGGLLVSAPRVLPAEIYRRRH
jgi:hypothetical protein